jgi:hypothetical protein
MFCGTAHGIPTRSNNASIAFTRCDAAALFSSQSSAIA